MNKVVTNKMLLVISLAVLYSAGSAYADTIRCGTHIIDQGTSADKILEVCGEPTSRQAEEWVYDRGADGLSMRIHFNPDGGVSHIEEIRAQQ